MKTFLLFLLYAFVLSAEPELRLYPVQFTDPEEAAEIIRLMSSNTNDLTVRVTDRKLAVRGTPEQHDETAMILRELDKAPRNIQINVAFSTAGRTSSREAGIRQSGPLIIHDGGIHGSLRGGFRDQSTRSSENVTQMLVAMDGRSATLRVGERVPHLAWLTQYSYRHGIIREVQIEWRDVGSFLAVYPEIIGDGPLVRIRLVPELSGRLENGDEKTIQFTELATEVVARDGQTVSIGGFSQDEEFSSRFLVGRSGGSEASITDITLTPRILR